MTAQKTQLALDASAAYDSIPSDDFQFAQWAVQNRSVIRKSLALARHQEMEAPRQIIYNAIRTPDGTVLVSRHRHDYQSHTDAVTGRYYAADGGHEYLKRCGDIVGMEELSLFDDEPHDVQRRYLSWGTYGKDGKDALSYRPVSEMSDDHIKAVLHECQPSPVIKHCMEVELDCREHALYPNIPD